MKKFAIDNNLFVTSFFLVYSILFSFWVFATTLNEITVSAASMKNAFEDKGKAFKPQDKG